MTADHPEPPLSYCSDLNYDDDDDRSDEKLDYYHIQNLWHLHDTIVRLRGEMSGDFLPRSSSLKMLKSSGERDVPAHTYVVIRLHKRTPQQTMRWLLGKITGSRRDGGAELLVAKQPRRDESDDHVFHVSASQFKFLETAEEMEMMKKDVEGRMREFTVKQLDDFLTADMGVDDLFTVADRQTIVGRELENIRATIEDHRVPGFPDFDLYEGQSVFPFLRNRGIITDVYPLHDEEHLKKLGHEWYTCTKQPLEEIRRYFGEAVALYFAFLGHYTGSLILPALLAVLQILIPTYSVLLFSVFNVVWLTVVLEFWKRKSNELAFRWGTIGMSSLDEERRANFRGAMAKDPITGKILPQYKRSHTYFKMYCVSLPIVAICLGGAFLVMLCSFRVEDWSRDFPEPYCCLPSIVYSILVNVINVYYRKLAIFLTEWENHRTESQFALHKVTKLVLFEFVNNFMALFYIAFVVRDLNNLRSQLRTMFITSLFLNNFTETLLPILVQLTTKTVDSAKKRIFSNVAKEYLKPPADDRFDMVPTLPENDPRIESAESEALLDSYEETFDDYLELFVQFGYVFLFSSVYPEAAIWALLSNLVEIRADAFKLCRICRRPMARKAKNIGAWQRAFEALGALSILTNCLVLYLSPSSWLSDETSPKFTSIELVIIFVLLEHFLLIVQYILHISIPDQPEWVRVALARENYESKQALKHEREQRNRRILTKRFESEPVIL